MPPKEELHCKDHAAVPPRNWRNPSQGGLTTPEQGLLTLATNQNPLWNSFKAMVSQTAFVKMLIQWFWNGAKESVALKLLNDSHAQPRLRTTCPRFNYDIKNFQPLRNHRTYGGRRGIE